MKINKTVTGYIERKEIEELIERKVGYKINNLSFDFDKENNVIGADFTVDESKPMKTNTRELKINVDNEFKMDSISNKEIRCPVIPDKFEIRFNYDDSNTVKNMIRQLNQESRLGMLKDAKQVI